MGLKEAKDGFFKAHAELLLAMGQEVERIGQEVTVVDEELAQLGDLLECKHKQHAEYELAMFKQVRAASKVHDEEVLRVSQQIELRRKKKEQLSNSLHSMLHSSFPNLALPDKEAPAGGGTPLAQQQPHPHPAVIDSDPREVMVKLEATVEPPLLEAQPVAVQVSSRRPWGNQQRGPKKVKYGRKKMGASLATVARPDPDAPGVRKRRKMTELMVAGGSTKGAPGTGRYFLRKRPSGSPTPGSVMVALT